MTVLTDFINIMDKGGPIMWVIFIAASIAMVLLVWQSKNLIAYSMLSTIDLHKLSQQENYLPEFQPKKVLSPLAQLLILLNWSEIKTKHDFAREMNVHMAEIALKVEGNLPTIATLGTLLPMLGLLGTVTGMINVFEVIAIHGSGKPEEMANGISQAMLTTASGLIIAIPVIFMHHLLLRRQTVIMTSLVQSMQMILHHDPDKIKTTIQATVSNATTTLNSNLNSEL